MKSCENDRFGMWEALFETYWLSGGRLNEVRIMKIKDVIKVNGGQNIKVGLRDSKTVSRPVPSSLRALISGCRHMSFGMY